MARAPYTFVQPGGVVQPIFHIADLGQRLAALAPEGCGVNLEIRAAPAGLDVVQIAAVPAIGAPIRIGQVVRPHTPDLRNRIALAVALAQSDRAGRRLERAA